MIFEPGRTYSEQVEAWGKCLSAAGSLKEAYRMLVELAALADAAAGPAPAPRCGDRIEDFVCSLPKGHAGDHQGVRTAVLAEAAAGTAQAPSDKHGSLEAWGDDVPLRGEGRPKDDGKIKHLIEYLLTVYKRFGNTVVTADLQWGASALHKRDEQKDRIAELENELALTVAARDSLKEAYRLAVARSAPSSTRTLDAGTVKAALVWGMHTGVVERGDFARISINGMFNLHTVAEYLSGKISAASATMPITDNDRRWRHLEHGCQWVSWTETGGETHSFDPRDVTHLSHMRAKADEQSANHVKKLREGADQLARSLKP